MSLGLILAELLALRQWVDGWAIALPSTDELRN